MRARIAAVLLLLTLLPSMPAKADDKNIYFSVTASKTFRPGEKPKVELYARNVDVLEFRVYRVHDAAKFFEHLQNVHQIGVKEYAPREQVDERTWLEKFHDWKHDLWRSIRDFFRRQFTAQNRAQIRARHSERAKRSRISGTAGFADVPILNAQQLVARWRMELPSKYVSESSDVPIEGLTAGAYVVEATDGTYRAYTVLLISEMALVTKTSEGQIVAYTAQRGDGKPVADATITAWKLKKEIAQFKTDEQGIGEAKIVTAGNDREASSEEGTEFVLAQHGDDVAIVAPYSLNVSTDPSQDWLGYVYTDRPVYRPGDTVQFKGIVRHKGNRLELPSVHEVKVTIEDGARNTILQKSYPLSPFGSINGSLELPKTAALGYYSISISVATGNLGGSFQVEEYKKPEYFVKVTPESPRTLQGNKMKVTIEARYYFGEPVANAKVKYVVHTQRSWFFEDEGSDYELPSMNEGGGDEGAPDDSRYFYGEQIMEESGKLDANGRLVITIPTKVEEKYKNDVDYRVEARVTDASNREIPGHNAFLATYGTFHVSVEAQSYVYKLGETGQFTVKAQDYDKKPVATPVHIDVSQYLTGHGGDRVTDRLDVTTGADGLAHFSLPLKNATSYTVKATAPSAGRQVESQTWFWVAGANENTWAEGEARTLQFVADKATYKVGDIAHVLVMGLPANTDFLLTTEGNTVLTKSVIDGSSASATVDVPITLESQPNVFVSVSCIRDNQLYQGSKSLNVPPAERRLSIEIAPAKQQFQPGEAALYNIVAKDWQGKPVRAELSVGVVDDAVYAVEPDTAGDIVKAFYYERYGSVQTNSSFEYYFHGEAGKRTIEIAKLKTPSIHHALAQVKASDFVQPKVRKAFPDTAYWNPTIITDANGAAIARLSFPDSLTTWRTTVRAVTEDTRGGWAVNRVLVRKNLMVRLAVPRFFRAGDEVTVSAIVHNYLESTKTARVSLEATGLELVNGSTQDVTVPNKGEAKVDWRVRTSANATAARLLAKALTNEESDAMELTLPVIPFGVKQGINASGAISEPSAQRTAAINFPASVQPSSRSIDLEVSPSIVGSIFGSLEFLTAFPYGCTEQTMSSFLPNVVVTKTLQDLNIKSSVEPTRLKSQVEAGLQRLYDFQHDDGGWGWWKTDDSMVFMTAYVVSGLQQAQDAGYNIDNDRLDKGKRFLHQALKKHPNMISDLRAYVVYSLALAGDRDKRDLDSVWDRRDKLSAEGIAFAGLTMQMEKDSRVNDAAQALRGMMKTEGDAVYWQSTRDDLMEIEIDTSAEATAYAVKFLTQLSSNDDTLPKAVLWLMRHRDGGYYWYSTKQTAMVIYGVTDYLKASKELEASFTADVLVNGKSVLTKKFTPQDATSVQPITLHLAPEQIGSNNQIEVRKNGTGRLYWSARGNYYSTDKKLYNNAKLSLAIARDYYKLVSHNNGQKITYDLTPLNGPVQSGDVLAIRVSVSGSNWKYLLIEDPIPAGTEFIEHDELYELTQRPSWWGYWFSRREYHDDRAAIFQTFFDRSQEYVYLVKVVNPGIFQISPASVQPMYQPDVLSTTDPSRLEVK